MRSADPAAAGRHPRSGTPADHLAAVAAALAGTVIGHGPRQRDLQASQPPRPTAGRTGTVNGRSRRVVYGEPGREILGIVGKSGSGKSTLARALCGIAPFTGELTLQGTRLSPSDRMSRAWRRDVQIIFQNPDASLNPRHRIGTILGRPLRLYGKTSPKTLVADVSRMLEEVGLPPAYSTRHPHELSGGEKQRVAIARAFVAAPKLVICDEVTSALDVVVQAEIVQLLVALQARHQTAFLFITHDLNLVRQIGHRIAVMHRGRLVDLFDAAHFASADRHPYTQTLLQAVARL